MSVKFHDFPPTNYTATKKELKKAHKHIHDKTVYEHYDWLLNKSPDRYEKMYLQSERFWYLANRPYYNLFPIIQSMLGDVPLDIKLSALHLPVESLYVRFPANSRFIGLLMSDQPDSLFFTLYYRDAEKELTFESGRVIKAPYMDKTISEIRSEQPLGLCPLKIFVAISILSDSPEFIQPVILSKDLLKWKNGDDETRKQLAEKAIRRTGKTGFNVGKEIQETYETTPHFRRPHLALFWTGKGRAVPKMILRKGCAVKPRELTTVPTGYLGIENQ